MVRGVGFSPLGCEGLLFWGARISFPVFCSASFSRGEMHIFSFHSFKPFMARVR